MSNITLEAIWVGSFRASRFEAEQLHAQVLVKAESFGLSELVANVSSSANGLTQFMIHPCGSKEGMPDQASWEKLVAYAAMSCAGSDFSIKRLYVAAN
jgi:hypothetical protein